MQAAIASFLTKLLLSYVKRHPQVALSVAAEVEKAIPGKVDDYLLDALVKLLLSL